MFDVWCVAGPRLFLSCPMNTSESHGWFTDLWNYSIVPYLLEAVRDGVQVCLPHTHRHNSCSHVQTRSALPPTKVFRRLAVNKTTLKPRLAAATGRQYVYVGFFRRNKIPHSSTSTISEKAIQFQHQDYNPDWAQKLISLSMSRHLSTRNISSQSMRALWVILLTDRQTDKHGQKHLPPPLSEVNYAMDSLTLLHTLTLPVPSLPLYIFLYAKCFPCLFYAIEACPVNKTQEKS